MGRLILHVAVTINGAFETPVPAPDGWLVLDTDSQQASLEMWQAADAMVIGRKTYEGLAEVWPQLATVPGYEDYAHRMNNMPKYVASQTLRGPLTWNATLLKGDLVTSVRNLKEKYHGNLIVAGAGELARSLITQNLIDEFWFTVSPYLWPSGPKVFDELNAIPLDLVATMTFPSGVMQLRYRPTSSDTPSNG